MSKFFQFDPDVFNEPAIQQLTHSKKYIAALMLSDARNFFRQGIKKSGVPYALNKSVRSMMKDYGALKSTQIKEVREYLVDSQLLKVIDEGSKRGSESGAKKFKLLAILKGTPGTQSKGTPGTLQKGTPGTRKLYLNNNTQLSSPHRSEVELSETKGDASVKPKINFGKPL